MNTDPISDFLTRIRNANSAGHKTVVIPASNVKKEITNKLNAVELVNLISTKVDGKPGGGRPDMAQSGGQNIKGVQNAINQLKKYLINK